jgi:serine/threonine protein kinase
MKVFLFILGLVAESPLRRDALERLLGYKQAGRVEPDIWGSHPDRWDESPLGPVALTQSLHEGMDGSVFTGTAGNTYVVVKYVNDCSYRSRMKKRMERHPLVTESVFLLRLNESDIAPKIYYLSPPAAIVSSPSDVEGFLKDRHKTRYMMTHLDSCLALKPEIRFMLQEPVGFPLDLFLGWSVGALPPSREITKTVLQTVSKALGLVEKLHEMGIIHGDIHFGNIAFRNALDKNDDVENEQLVLIDFEKAVLIKDIKDFDFTYSSPRHLNKKLLSPWQLQGYPPAPRDDVYRLLFQTASWLTRGDLEKNVASKISPEMRSHDKVEVWLEFHRTQSLFSDAKLGDDLEHEEDCSIRLYLNAVVESVKRLPHPTSKVPFTQIQNELRDIIKLL